MIIIINSCHNVIKLIKTPSTDSSVNKEISLSFWATHRQFKTENKDYKTSKNSKTRLLEGSTKILSTHRLGNV